MQWRLGSYWLTYADAAACWRRPPERVESGGPHQCTSRRLAQSIMTNMVTIATAIETLNRALRMGAPFGSGRQVPATPGSYPTAVNIFWNRTYGGRTVIGW